ncbi:MAG: hypothetical protein AAGK78_13615, partial [Planctomycetota bacterium]
ADLHYDVPRSKQPAMDFAEQVNAMDVDAVLLVGDTATSADSKLEEALALFRGDRVNLFVPGNHELWNRKKQTPVNVLLKDELPRRVRNAGWHWLPGDPWRRGTLAIVGNGGWYDYQFASPRLGLPDQFYEAGLSPAAARRLERHDLEPWPADLPDFYARWNDKRFIHELGDDRAFNRDRLSEFRDDLLDVSDAATVVAGVHVCPTQAMLPRVPDGPIPESKLRFAFVRAFLGSPAYSESATGEVVRVDHGFCGHSHVPRPREPGSPWQNIGSDYTTKRHAIVTLTT